MFFWQGREVIVVAGEGDMLWKSRRDWYKVEYDLRFTSRLGITKLMTP